MSKRVPYSRIKSNRTYTFEEAANQLERSPATIRRWVRREGLLCLSERRPYLLLGSTLKEFLRAKFRKSGAKLGPTEFLCFTCKVPRNAVGEMVDYVPISMSRARLLALCSVCGSLTMEVQTARVRGLRSGSFGR